MNKLLRDFFPWLALVTIVFLSVVVKIGYEIKQSRAPNILKAAAELEPLGPKKYVMFNRDDFSKKPGAKMKISAKAVVFEAMAAKNVKEMEGINGFTFEADQDPPKIKALESSGWVIQEEVRHTILPFSCSRCETIPCPSPAPNPGPNPNPSPEPTPTPNPTPIEADRSWGRARVHAKEAQALVDTSQVKVCVVDTGIDMQHPNKGNVIGTQSFAGQVQDRAGHGTHTAGTIGGNGGVGVSRAKLLVCKGLGDDGSGSSSSLAQCLSWCGSQGAQVVSNSWGSTQSDQLINQSIQALTQKGIYVFVAAGNDSGPVNWPAKLSGSNPLVYAIAASDQSDRITSFSSRGPEIKYISPGENIVSNWPGGGTRSLAGTSMATPHAAAICAFGVARGRKPCISTNGTISGYPFADALASAK